MKQRTNYNLLFPAIMLIVMLTILAGPAYPYDRPSTKTITCSSAYSSSTVLVKEVMYNTALTLDLEDFLACETGSPAGTTDFIEIPGPVENGRLVLHSVSYNEDSVPVCFTDMGEGPDNALLNIQWPSSPDGMEYITETCSSASLPVELFNVRDNLQFVPDGPFTGPVNIRFRIGTRSGETLLYSAHGEITLDIIHGPARSSETVRSAVQPKDYILRALEGSVVKVGKTLKSLAGKTTARVRIVELPDNEVGLLKVDSTNVQSGQEILSSQLTSLYFSPSNNPDFFGDLTIKWLAITSAGDESSTATLVIRYKNVVDRPTTGNASVTISKDTTKTFTTDDFPYQSKDNATFNKLKIGSIPGSKAGRLEYNNTWIKSAGKTVDLSSGTFVFRPVEGKTGKTSFKFYVGSGAKFSKQSSTFEIDVIEPVVLTDAPELFTSIIATTNTSPTWNWGILEKATGYEITFDEITWTDVGSKLLYTPESPLTPGDYTFHLRGKNEMGSGPEVTNSFKVLPQFSDSTPSFNETVSATIDSTPSWTWDSLTGAVGYEVSIDGTTWIDRGSNQNYTRPDSSPLSVGPYTIYLRAYNISSTKSLAATSSFTIVSDLSALTPTLTVTVTSTSSIPSWSWNAVPGATSYETSFDNITWTDRGAGLSYTPAAQLDTGSHTFYLRARNEASTSTHVEDPFVIFKTLPVNPAVTLPDISVTESGDLSLNNRQKGSILLSNLFVDPDGYTVNLGEPVIACENKNAISASISTSKSFDWVSDGIGKCTVTIQGSSGPDGNLKTGSTSFNIEIKPQAITLANVLNACGRPKLDTLQIIDIGLNGIGTSLLSDSQIKGMLTITALDTSGGAIDPSSISSNGTWTIPIADPNCSDTHCLRLDKIQARYKVVDDTKLDHIQVKMTFGGVITTKQFDIGGRFNEDCL